MDLELFGMNINKDERIFEPVEIDIKYDGYIKRQKELIKQAVKMEQYKIPADMDYQKIKGLSLEEIEKLSAKKPCTLDK